MQSIGKIVHIMADRVGYWLAAAELATATGGGRLTSWVLELLEIRPDDRILEIGCGPDMLLETILKAYKGVFAAGVDGDAALIVRAWRRNAPAIRRGRAMLIQTDVAAALPAFTLPFTKVVAVNSPILAARPLEVLRAVRATLAPHGKIVIAVQPAAKGATAADARHLGKELRQHMAAAGFASLWLAEKDLKSTPAVCVTGVNPVHANISAAVSPHRHGETGVKK